MLPASYWLSMSEAYNFTTFRFEVVLSKRR